MQTYPGELQNRYVQAASSQVWTFWVILNNSHLAFEGPLPYFVGVCMNHESSTTLSQESSDLDAGKIAENPTTTASQAGERLGGESVVGAAAKKSWLYRIVSTVILLAGTGGAAYTYPQWKPALDSFVRPSATARPKPRPPLVALATAKAESIPQFINCIGTVTAFNSVVVKSRVEGELIEVAFNEGQLVEQGQLLARIDPRPFEAVRDQMKGQLERDEASLALARLTYERVRQLIARDAASQQELDESSAAMRQSEAAVTVDRAALANAELQLSYTKIHAPIRGRVGLRMLDIGNMVKANDITGIAVITQLQPISVVFTIPQDEIPSVRSRLNDVGAVDVLAFDRSFEKQIAIGKLTAVDNQVDASTGTLKLKALFENNDETLFPNQFVNIRLLVKQWEEALVIPTTAIQRGPDSSFVYVVNDEAKVDLRKVKVIFSDAGKSVIESGIQPGDKVVVEGTDKLQPGGMVTLPGAKPPGEGKPGEGKPGEGRPGEGKPGEGKPGEGKPGEGKPGETGDTRNGERVSGDRGNEGSNSDPRSTGEPAKR